MQCINYYAATKIINPLVPEFSAQCTLQNTGNSNDHTLLYLILADHFR